MDCTWGKTNFNTTIEPIMNDTKKKTQTQNGFITEDTLYTAKELIYWSSKNSGNELVFDTLLDIHDDVQTFLNSHNLKIKTDTELFLMKLLLFVYDNTAS
jgi:hypothetical protein